MSSCVTPSGQEPFPVGHTAMPKKSEQLRYLSCISLASYSSPAPSNRNLQAGSDPLAWLYSSVGAEPAEAEAIPVMPMDSPALPPRQEDTEISLASYSSPAPSNRNLQAGSDPLAWLYSSVGAEPAEAEAMPVMPMDPPALPPRQEDDEDNMKISATFATRQSEETVAEHREHEALISNANRPVQVSREDLCCLAKGRRPFLAKSVNTGLKGEISTDRPCARAVCVCVCVCTSYLHPPNKQ